ncbi:dTDP-4-dehydrorhamnose reductase [Desulfosporosinus sp. HMP52]|nr:dTDP-4-dehydrorhamnose reductase [Desulfosporosinus sp. HMP52]
MLGHTLFRYLSKDARFDVYTTVRSTNVLSHWLPADWMKKVYADVDVFNADSLTKIFSDVSPDIVVNCIGVIKQVPKAQDPLTTIWTNALLPHTIAKLCSAAGSRFIHISTDCVFTGEKGGYLESDVADALDLYGRTKLLGEVDYSHCVTLRTSIIGHELQGYYGLVEWFLGQKEKVSGFCKAIYSGLPTIEFARIIRDHVIPDIEMTGLYHVSANPISKYELLKLIKAQYNKNVEVESDNKVQIDRSLDSTRFRSLTGYNPPSWKDLVHEMYLDYLQGPYHYGKAKGDKNGNSK